MKITLSKNKKTLFFALYTVLVLTLGVIVQAQYQVQHQTKAADVSEGDGCMYPNRFNADGSCDNSDPACPETLKDPVLHGDCPITQTAPAQEPVKVEQKPTQNNQCN